MKIPFEENMPYRLLALAVLVLFYGIYFAKMLVQHRRGIQTRQIGKRKEKSIHTVELLMSIATLGAPLTQILSIVFDWNYIPVGTRFSCDKYNWAVTEKIESLKYYLTCETAGADPNGYTGQLIPIEYIEGLATAELTSIVINGEDEEATETLRLRYLNSFENQSYGFNRGQYIEVTEALPGVGGCKPYRAWKGPGTVKLVITGSDYQPPSDTLINTVQTAIDPTQNSGDGIGLAPIDHEVTVVGAAGTTVNISTTLTFASGWNLTECLPYIQSALDAYYLELNSTWSKEAGLIVRVSQIESRLLALAGIVDISGTTLNGQAGNLTLDKDAVAVRGSFTNA